MMFPSLTLDLLCRHQLILQMNQHLAKVPTLCSRYVINVDDFRCMNVEDFRHCQRIKYLDEIEIDLSCSLNCNLPDAKTIQRKSQIFRKIRMHADMFHKVPIPRKPACLYFIR